MSKRVSDNRIYRIGNNEGGGVVAGSILYERPAILGVEVSVYGLIVFAVCLGVYTEKRVCTVENILSDIGKSIGDSDTGQIVASVECPLCNTDYTAGDNKAFALLSNSVLDKHGAVLGVEVAVYGRVSCTAGYGVDLDQ